MWKATKHHLNESGMTYRQHLYHSLVQSARLTAIAIKSLIHGFIPPWFSSSGPVGVYKIYKEIRNMQHVSQMFKDHDEHA